MVKVESLAVERVESLAVGGEVATVERVARAVDPLASLVRVAVESPVRVVDQVRQMIIMDISTVQESIMDQAATATTTTVDGVHIAVRRRPVTTTTVDGDHIAVRRHPVEKVARAAGPLASLERVAIVQSLARAVVHPLLIHGIHRIRGMMDGDTAHHQVQAAVRVARAGDN